MMDIIMTIPIHMV